MAIKPLKGDIVDFDFVNNVIMGGPVRGATISGEPIDFSVATMLDAEILTIHNNLYRYFAESVGNVNSAAAYSYIVITPPNGGRPRPIGIPWITETTYRVITARKRVYIIDNFQERMKGPLDNFLRDLGAVFTTTDTNE